MRLVLVTSNENCKDNKVKLLKGHSFGQPCQCNKKFYTLADSFIDFAPHSFLKNILIFKIKTI